MYKRLIVLLGIFLCRREKVHNGFADPAAFIGICNQINLAIAVLEDVAFQDVCFRTRHQRHKLPVGT